MAWTSSNHTNIESGAEDLDSTPEFCAPITAPI